MKLETILQWAWKAGLDITLKQELYLSGERVPCLGLHNPKTNLSTFIRGMDEEDLWRRIIHSYKDLHSQLCCPELKEEDEKEKE